MLTRIAKPDDSEDYTNQGSYKGPKGYHFTTGYNYNLIYDQHSNSVSARNDVGDWYQLDGTYFDVTHHYTDAVPDLPTAAPADPRWADDDDSIADVPAPCGNITASEAVARTAPCTASDIPEGPESTADLRQYRYTPDTY